MTTAYSVPVAMSALVNVQSVGTVEVDLKAGVVEPSDDAQAAALEILARNGLIEVAKAKQAKTTAKSEPAPAPEQE